jgi:AraC-like DNA-binding protein
VLRIQRLARIAEVSEAHFMRTFRATFGETPHHYLQHRRIESAMFPMRTTDRIVTDVCFEVGFNSLGTFSLTLHDIVGEMYFAKRGRMPRVSAIPVRNHIRIVQLTTASQPQLTGTVETIIAASNRGDLACLHDLL